MEALNAGDGRHRAYTTYMTIMARLYKKGLLHRRREGKTDFYAPVYVRERYMALRAGAEVRELVAVYGDVALTQFAQHVGALDPARRRALERLAKP
jgi:predicted transcriptional regulator